MSTLLLIRHGQASFGAGNYDKLSEMGITQSFFLGEHWVQTDRKIDFAVSGIQQRQKHTLEVVADVYRVAGKTFPEPLLDESFNEYDATGIMTKFFPKLMTQNARLQEIMRLQSSGEINSTSGRKSFQEVFEIVMNRWIEGDTGADDLESWDLFNSRVVVGIKRIMEEHPDGKTVAIFTSGGPICAAMKFALDLTYRKALELSWVVKNAGITEFKFKRDKFTLTGFNMTPHFHDEALVTFR